MQSSVSVPWVVSFLPTRCIPFFFAPVCLDAGVHNALDDVNIMDFASPLIPALAPPSDHLPWRSSDPPCRPAAPGAVPTGRPRALLRASYGVTGEAFVTAQPPRQTKRRTRFAKWWYFVSAVASNAHVVSYNIEVVFTVVFEKPDFIRLSYQSSFLSSC